MSAILSIGGIAFDVIMHVPQIPDDGVCVSARRAHHGLGGKAANQAIAAARLGADAAIIGAVGGDSYGDVAIARLMAESVNVEHVRRVEGATTGIVVLQRTPAGAKSVSVYSGANATLTPWIIDAAEHAIRRAAIVLVQLEIPTDAVVRAVEIAREAGVRVILDASPVRPLPRTLLGSATVLKANAREATALTGIDVRDLDSARAAAAWFLQLGIAIVAIEAGTEGNLFLSSQEEIFLPLDDVESLDATGAGDALTGALAVALVESKSLRAAAEFATAAAALTTRALGAEPAMPRRDEIARLQAVRAAT